jgi:hypothetical protein
MVLCIGFFKNKNPVEFSFPECPGTKNHCTKSYRVQ